MGWNIRRISSDSPRVRGGTRAGRRKAPLLDEKLKYSPYEDEEWTYEENEILYNGESVNELVNEYRDDTPTLVSLSGGLADYREFVWNSGGKDKTKFNGRMDILLGKVTSRLGCIYEEKLNGITCQFVDGDLWVNGINVSMLIDLYKSRPEPKVKAYLMSWRSKLSLILSHQKTNTSCNVWWKAAKDLLIKLDTALYYTPDSTHLLESPDRE